MQVHVDRPRARPRGTALRSRAWRWHWPLRAAGAALLLAMAWIHWHLHGTAYSTVPRIGPLFLLDAALGAVAALALLLTPRRWLPLVELGGGLLLLGTLAALLVSTTVGLFGFTETWDAPLVRRTVAVEGAGSVLLLAAAFLHGLPFTQRNRARRRRLRRRPGSARR